MPEYDLYVICPHCKAFHDSFLRVFLDDTFEVLRVSDVYGKNVPTYFYQAVSELRCPNTGKLVNQNNANLMVLAEIGKFSAHSKPKDD